MASDTEVLFEPDLHSTSCYAILGCGRTVSSETLRRAYRDLSRKYHPGRHQSNDQTRFLFQRIYVAYSTILGSQISRENIPFDDDAMQTSSLEDAEQAYENAFGEFRDSYYSKGAIIGLPYSYQLRESLERSECIREALSFTIGCVQFSFLRSFLIKKELGALFLFLEITCTWGAIVLAVWNLLLEEFPDKIKEIPSIRDLDVDEIPHVSIVGGAAVLIGNFVQYFWYGFTRQPIIIDKDYETWLEHGRTKDGEEISDIQDACSSAFHSDSCQRCQLFTLFSCTPLLIVDHMFAILASIPVFLYYLCKTHEVRSQSSEADLAYQYAKSFGALISVVAYYLVWVFGGNYAKVVVAAALVVNQQLYSALLHRKSFGGFLQSLLFGSVFAITLVRKTKNDLKMKDEDATATSDIERGLTTANMEPFNIFSETESDTQHNAPWDEVEESSKSDESDDPNAFEVNFDGFYRTQSMSSAARSAPSTQSMLSATRSAPSVPPPLLPPDDNIEEVVDYRGRKEHKKPVPSWYKNSEHHKRNRAPQVGRNTSFASMFQCSNDTVDETEVPLKVSSAGSTTTGRNSTTQTKSTTQTEKTNKTAQTERTETTEATDMIALARSAKRKIEAEFYARVFGMPVDDDGAQATPARTASSRRRGSGTREKKETPQVVEIDEAEPSALTQMSDESSDNSSSQDSADHHDASIEEEPPKDLDDLLGPFTPSVRSLTTRTTPTHSESFGTGPTHPTKKLSNREDSNAKQIREDSRDYIIHHNLQKGPYKTWEVERGPTSPSTGGVESVPNLIIGAQGSADESEVTMDKRQFKRKQQDNGGYFWQFIGNPTTSTLTRSVT